MVVWVLGNFPVMCLPFYHGVMVGEIYHLGLLGCCVPNVSYVPGMALSTEILVLAGRQYPGRCQLHSGTCRGSRIKIVRKRPREVLAHLMEKGWERLGNAGTFCTCLGVGWPIALEPSELRLPSVPAQDRIL